MNNGQDLRAAALEGAGEGGGGGGGGREHVGMIGERQRCSVLMRNISTLRTE